jgi:hypothetical protein
LAALVLVLLVSSACGTEPAPSAASVEVGPESVLLTGAGEEHKLAAVVRSADGAPIELPVSWDSSDATIASVDAAGSVRAVADVGTTEVIASVGSIRSAPVLVTVAQPVTGAVLITDAQIVGAPTSIDADPDLAQGAHLEVSLRGVTGLSSGVILINTEAQPIAGRVESMEPRGEDLRVRLAVVPPTELFTDFAFEDRLDLATDPFEIPAELAEAYDVTQTGASFVFMPKDGSASRPGAVLARSVIGPAASPVPRYAGAQGTQALPPLPPFKECEAELGFGSGLPVPLSLSTPPAFSFTAAGSVVRVATPQGTTFTVRGTPTFAFTSILEVTSGFEAKLECKLTLARQKFRAPGWAGLFFGGDVEYGVGFEVGGKVTLLAAKVGGSVEVKPVIEATLACPTGRPCSLDGDVTADSTLSPTLEAPSLNQAQFEPSVNLFGFVSLEAGNADIEALQFDAIEAQAGVELAAGLTLEGLQMANTDAEGGRSKYELALKGKVGPGVKLGSFLSYLGLDKTVPLELSFAVPLGESPTGTVTADRARYLPGDHVTITVALDGASTRFPSGGIYNVDRVVLLRATGLTSQVLASAAAADGQTAFELAFDAPGLLDAGELFAFVVTRLLPLDPPKLEIGAAVSQGVTPGTFEGTVDVSILGDSRNSNNVGNYMKAAFAYDLRVTIDAQGAPTGAAGTVRVTSFQAKENGSGCKSDFTFAGSGTQPNVSWSTADLVGTLTAAVQGTYTEAKRCSGGFSGDDSGRVSFNVPPVTWVPEFDSSGEVVALVFDGRQRADAQIGVGESDVQLRWTGRLERVP